MIDSKGAKTRLGFSYIKTRFWKEGEYFIYPTYIALAITVLILFLTERIFPNFILEDGLFNDWQRSIGATEPFYSETAEAYLDPNVVRGALMTKILDAAAFSIFYFFIILATSFAVTYPYYNRFMEKKVDGLTDDNVIAGTEVLTDDKFLEKYSALSELSEDSFSLTEIYKFKKVNKVPKNTQYLDLNDNSKLKTTR